MFALILLFPCQDVREISCIRVDNVYILYNVIIYYVRIEIHRNKSHRRRRQIRTKK